MNSVNAIADATPRPWLAAIDPRTRVAWMFAVSVMSVLVDSPQALALLAVASLAMLSGLRMRPRGWVALLGTLALISWSVTLTQGIFYAWEPRTPLLTVIPPTDRFGGWLPAIVIYREGMLYGLVQSLRVVAIGSAGMLLCLSTGPERLLVALGQWRAPAEVTFVTMTALRMTPTLIADASSLRQAAWLRGHRFRPWRFQAWRTELGLFLPLMAAAVRRATALATSVTMRAHNAQTPRTSFYSQAMKSRDRLLIAVLIGAVAVMAIYKMYAWWSLSAVTMS